MTANGLRRDPRAPCVVRTPTAVRKRRHGLCVSVVVVVGLLALRVFTAKSASIYGFPGSVLSNGRRQGRRSRIGAGGGQRPRLYSRL